eukprot:1920532-Alexandrium_andersonii.AAC.1
MASPHDPRTPVGCSGSTLGICSGGMLRAGSDRSGQLDGFKGRSPGLGCTISCALRSRSLSLRGRSSGRRAK